MAKEPRPLAIVTGASSGIGYELAVCAADDGYELVICADEPDVELAADKLRSRGTDVTALQADLATTEGVDKLYAAARGLDKPVEVLMANAGRGLGKGFMDQDWRDIRCVIDTNVTGTTYLLHRVGRDMRARSHGRILITGSIAGFMPGTYQAVYNATKAYL